MLWAVSTIVSLAIGWFIARALTAGAFSGPRWASFLVELSLGVLFGPGLTSILCFGLVGDSATNQKLMLGMLIGLLLASALVWWKLTPAPTQNVAAPKKFPWTWALALCAAAGLAFLFLDFQAAATANPHGEWDAMSIWNLRGRFLASGGDLWRRAISSEIGGHMTGAAHPGYPLFLSAFLALNWLSAGTPLNAWDTALPISVSLLISLGVLALVGSSLASRKSVALGLLASLVLLASEIFASQTSAQYSDLLQGLAFLATLVLIEAATESGSPRVIVAVGLAAGLSAWIKNEGLLFAIAALAVAVWRFRSRGLPWLALGAAPGLAAIATLKLIAQGADQTLPHDLGAAMLRITEPGRWWQAALGFGKAVYDAGGAITHPVLLAALLAFALRFIPAVERHKRMWLWIPIAVTAAAEYGLYLITEANLDWHISTSVSRLVAQLWPSLIWMFFWTLRTPEDVVEATPAPVPVRAPKKVAAKRSK
jgi:hypothetical protein